MFRLRLLVGVVVVVVRASGCVRIYPCAAEIFSIPNGRTRRIFSGHAYAGKTIDTVLMRHVDGLYLMRESTGSARRRLKASLQFTVLFIAYGFSMITLNNTRSFN